MKHRRVLTVIIFLSVSFVTVLGAPTPAYGCSCDGVGLHDFADEVDLAFVGQQVSRVVHDEIADNGTVLMFEVETVYKGEVAAMVRLATNAQESACGMDYSGAGRVAIVASKWRGQPSVNLCRSFVTEAELQQEFGDGHVPEPELADVETTAEEADAIAGSIPAGAADPGGGSSWIYLGGACLVLVAGGGLIAWRRLRPDA